MLASATDGVNAMCSFAQDHPLADFAAREECVLNVGRALTATWLGQLAGVAGHGRQHAPNVASSR
jgi:hypothetical protein